MTAYDQGLSPRDSQPSLPAPALEHLDAFISSIEACRRATDATQWREFAARDTTLRNWRFLLAEDPYTRWGLLKPRGYPGDAALMDFAYGHPSIRPVIDAASPVAQAIYRATSGAPQSQSARLRIQALTERLSRGVRDEPDFSAISIAAGHAREVEALAPAVRAGLRRFTVVDNDPVSLAVAERSAAGIATQPVRRNVVTKPLDDLPAAALVYSLGLFDYLTDQHAIQLLRRMWALVRPGGELLIANLADDAANLGYCEAVMDWWMLPRSAGAMDQLGAAVADGDELAAPPRTSRVGCFYFLSLIRRP